MPSLENLYSFGVFCFEVANQKYIQTSYVKRYQYQKQTQNKKIIKVQHTAFSKIVFTPGMFQYLSSISTKLFV